MLRKSKIILAMLLVVLMSVTAITPVLATGDLGDPIFAEGEDRPARAAITKQFRLPIGTPVPSVRFVFEMIGISIDDDLDRGKDAPIPHEDDLTILITAANDRSGPVNGIYTITEETLDIFGKITFDSAGEYVYEITEFSDTNTAIEENEDEWLNYSKAKYRLHVFVANKTDGSGETYIYAIGTRFITNHDGTPGDGRKVDATPGGNGAEYHTSQMIFVNDYVILDEPDKPDNPDPVDYASLFTSKTVTGRYGDLARFFRFDMELKPPIILDPDLVPAYYKGYVVEDDEVVTDENNAAEALLGEDDNDRPYIKIFPNRETTFHLKHGQKLVLMDTPVGTRYEVLEHGVRHYLPSVVVTTNGNAAEALTAENLGDELSTGPQHTGVTLNSAAFTNARDYVAPTGLNMNDLPFFVLIALGLGTLVTFVGVTVYRKKRFHR